MGQPEKSFTYRAAHNGVEVKVQPFYVPERSLPSRSIYFYAYAVTITNNRNQKIQLLKRQWSIRNGFGEEEAVEGDGVIGKNPEIAPGESFQYASFCPLHTETGNMRGRYQMKDVGGDMFWAKAPLFFFRLPQKYQDGSEEFRKSV